MNTLAETSLTPQERHAVERFAELVEAELGPDLRGVWLYGSRARGEEPKEDSDVDLIVVSTRGGPRDDLRLIELAYAAADAEGARAGLFSVKLYDPELIAQRREIKSFFMQEVDRDKIVLAGEP
ncbi:MAG: nucleotidyltransferase domain-containing protein [Actinobacteria bacterium]|nr:nucleotidyltransferase domain-containing protein [Actinomycetota bacterium]